MSYAAVMFLIFSVGFSWFSGDKKNDQLVDQLEESAYRQEIVQAQVKQSKIKASIDAKKMSELSRKISKLSKEKDIVKRKFARNKLRRARLLRPQIAKIKEKVEAPYKLKISKMQKAVKTVRADMAKLKAENDKLKRQYRELIRKNKERVSEIEDLTPSPFTEDGGINRMPVTRGDGLDKTPLTKEDGLDKTPLTKEEGLDKTPLTKEDSFDRTPITKEEGLDRAPITKEGDLDRAPITREGDLDRAPITREGDLDRAPITREGDLDRAPITREGDLDRAPITREGDLDESPFSKEDLLPVVPEEELVELDNGQLVKLDNIDGREKIPASKDLVSAEEILKEADASSEISGFIRVEQVNIKEGWL